MEHRVVLTGKGGLSKVTTVDMAVPECKENDVRIKVAYAGINFADLLMRLGLYQPRPPYPFTPGYEISGIVDAVGKGVTSVNVGDRVVAGMRNGGQASIVLCDASRVIPLPENVPFDVAAATPVTYMTAYHILQHLGNIQPHHSVLIHGGAGGVGTAALQICRWLGVTKIFATSSASKHHIIEEYGAHAIDRHSEDFVAIVKQHTNGRGVDFVLDPIGGDHLRRSLSVVAEGGALYSYGLSAAAPSSKRSLFKAFSALRKTPKFGPLQLMIKNRGVHGIHMGTWSDEEVMRTHMQALFSGIADGHLNPVIDRSFPSTDVQNAHKYLHEAKNIGKVLLKFHDIDAKHRQ